MTPVSTLLFTPASGAGAILAFLTLAVSPDIAAQVEWTKPVLEARSGCSFAFDPLRGVAVLYGSNSAYSPSDTWEWDGTSWHRRPPGAGQMPATGSPGMAFDPARSAIILHGGLYFPSQPSSDTWSWDGTTWTRLQTMGAPPVRDHFCVAYDRARGRLVLFGGNVRRVAYADTWEWDGTTWLQRQPATIPPGRTRAAMTYDSHRREVLLFGGYDWNQTFDDLWAWDGTDWRPRQASVRPSARVWPAMTFDDVRGRAVMYGGHQAGTDTWEWDGAAWHQLQPAAHPTSLAVGGPGHAMAFDSIRNQTLLLVGDSLWAWDGSNWRQLAQSSAPSPRANPGIAADVTNSTALLFGGDPNPGPGGDETWSWNGSAWTELQLTVRPPARAGHAMVADLSHGRIILFGGGDSSTSPGVTLQDQWEWNGTAWTQVSPTVLPSARSHHGMAYDHRRDRIVLFGGAVVGGASLGDTWEYDGRTWAQRSPPRAPSPRCEVAMAFDSRRGRTVLYGGATSLSSSSWIYDTWEWDGATWNQSTSAAPQLRAARLVYDFARDRCVLVGRDRSTGIVSSHEFDGLAWTPRTTTENPPSSDGLAPGGFALCYQPWSGRSLMFGDRTSNPLETWEYGPTHPASAASFGAACTGSNGAPSLAARPLPWLGDMVTFEAANLAAGPAVVLLGASDAVWNGTALPFDLGPLGMPGCQLLVDPEVVLPLAVAAGTGTFRLPVVPDPGLLGLSLYAQALAIDPLANLFGATVSNGLALTLGGR
jgi:hypothetical protein